MADIGYARVSTRNQKTDTQVDELTAAGCDEIFIDKGVSGKLAARPELDKAIARLVELGPGNNLVVTRLSRAMRSLRHFLALTGQLEELGMGLKVLKQDIDTTTPTGRLLFHILAAIAEFERELIVEGTNEGLASARERGNVGGHPSALNAQQRKLAKRLLSEGQSHRNVAAQLGTSHTTIYRLVKEA